MKTYFPIINLLRGMAAFFVCFYHFTNFSTHWGYFLPEDAFARQIGFYGSNGVFIFFVISGFVIPMSLHKEKFKLQFFHRFFMRRFVRVEIPYIASIFVILLVNFIIASNMGWNFSLDIKQIFLHFIYLIPWTNYEWINIIYWTLAIEIQYYILMAFLFLFLSHRYKWLRILGLLLFGASAFFFQNHDLIFYYSPTFLLGITLFMLKTERLKWLEASLLLVLFTIETIYIHSLTIALFSILTVVIIAFVHLENKLTDFFGNISYSLYLIHGIIGGQIIYFFGAKTSGFF